MHRLSTLLVGLTAAITLFSCGSTSLPTQSAAPMLTVQGQLPIHNADPSVIRVGSTYYSVEAQNSGGVGNIYARAASSVDGLGSATPTLIWSSARNMPNIWAPELVQDPGTGQFYVYFASGDGGSGQRLYVSASASPNRNFSAPAALALPDNKWAIDGTLLTFGGQRYFVWSGWAGDSNVEQNLYIARMASPTQASGARFIISQPRESWERVVGNPYINEGPEAIKDPNGQLHVVYSANGSWSDQYCLADLRLRAGGDPTNVWDWYKSNGCLFGSNKSTLMAGWDPTLYVNGPGHHSFVLQNGDIGTSPPAGSKFPLMFHAVPKGTAYSWGNRMWYSGSFMWWGNITYSRQNSPGAASDTGWSLKFFE